MIYKFKCPECGNLIAGSTKTELRWGERMFCDHCNKIVSCRVVYFPEDPNNKVFAVDTYVTLVKCIKVEAPDKDAAKKYVEDMMAEVFNLSEGDDCRALADMGFHCAEESEISVAGMADKSGEIQSQ